MSIMVVVVNWEVDEELNGVEVSWLWKDVVVEAETSGVYIDDK